MLRASLLNSTKLIAFTIFVLLAGCTDLAITNGIPSATSTNTVELSSTRTPTTPLSSPTATDFFPSAAPNYTMSPTTTHTPRPTSSLTWTPIPTLKPDESLEALLNLYKDNGGCQLPCWWGITPGETSWEFAREILAPLGSVSRYVFNDNLDIYEFGFEVPKNLDVLGFFEPRLWVENGSISAIGLNTKWIQQDFDYTLSGILTVFGRPEEIRIEVNTDTMDLPHYELDLFYPSKGLLFNSTGDARAVNDIAVTICPKEFRRGKYPPAILVWNPSHIYAYKEIGSDLLGGSRNIGGESFYLLGEAAIDFNEEDFYKTYKDPTTDQCFGIDLDKIPQ